MVCVGRWKGGRVGGQWVRLAHTRCRRMFPRFSPTATYRLEQRVLLPSPPRTPAAPASPWTATYRLEQRVLLPRLLQLHQHRLHHLVQGLKAPPVVRGQGCSGGVGGGWARGLGGLAGRPPHHPCTNAHTAQSTHSPDRLSSVSFHSLLERQPLELPLHQCTPPHTGQPTHSPDRLSSVRFQSRSSSSVPTLMPYTASDDSLRRLAAGSAWGWRVGVRARGRGARGGGENCCAAPIAPPAPTLSQSPPLHTPPSAPGSCVAAAAAPGGGTEGGSSSGALGQWACFHAPHASSHASTWRTAAANSRPLSGVASSAANTWRISSWWVCGVERWGAWPPMPCPHTHSSNTHNQLTHTQSKLTWRSSSALPFTPGAVRASTPRASPPPGLAAAAGGGSRGRGRSRYEIRIRHCVIAWVCGGPGGGGVGVRARLRRCSTASLALPPALPMHPRLTPPHPPHPTRPHPTPPPRTCSRKWRLKEASLSCSPMSRGDDKYLTQVPRPPPPGPVGGWVDG